MSPRKKGGQWRSLAGARGLCLSCWQLLQGIGELADYERLTRSREDLLEDYELLRHEGYTWRQCAERLGMTYAAFERAMLRARRAGDPRAARPGEVGYPTVRRAA